MAIHIQVPIHLYAIRPMLAIRRRPFQSTQQAHDASSGNADGGLYAAAPMGGHAAAAMAGMRGQVALGACAQAGAGQGPGPQAGMQQLFEELAEGGNGLNSLTRMLSLDDTEFWKGALVGPPPCCC